VEFALVVPILLTLVFAIIDYGLWFNNALSARQGVREAARQGIVANFAGASTCTSGSPAEQLACRTDEFIGPVTGQAYTKVVTPATWAQGSELLVCSIVVTDGVTGLVPLPAGGSVQSATRMSIEVVPDTPPTSGHTEGPSLDWSWCT
jgi:hypothetical protein